jgi:HlyD family secretion protein
VGIHARDIDDSAPARPDEDDESTTNDADGATDGEVFGFLTPHATDADFTFSDRDEDYPETWLEFDAKGNPRLKAHYRGARACSVSVAPNGKLTSGTKAWFLPGKFRLCLRCGATQSGAARDRNRLASLSAEGRSSATTVLVGSVLRWMHGGDSGLAPYTRKLVGFTDNRQDAALQSGHFNDFLFVSLIRAGFLGALELAGDKGLRSDELGSAQQKALGFDRRGALRRAHAVPLPRGRATAGGQGMTCSVPARFATVMLAASLLGSCDGSVDQRTAVGTLERDRIELVAEAQESIVEIRVREGQRVETGDLLLRLDDARVVAQVEQTRGARDRAAARLAELERGPRAERIREGRARLAGAEGLLTTAERVLARTRALVTQGIAAPDDLDRDRARCDDARASRDAARATLDELLEGATIEELDQARAALAEAEAALADLGVHLARLEVRAPRPGVVDALPFKQGERPPQGAVVAVMLAAMAPYARVYVPEPVRVHVRPGTAAGVHVDGIERSFHGRVRTVSHDAAFTPYFALTERDRSRLAYVAEVDLVDTDARDLPTGVPVEVTFELTASDAVPEETSRE